MQSIGFKEWALVCEALGTGKQRVIIRKGGLAEGRDGFAFRHREFFLLPTFFHEQVERVRLPAAVLPVPWPNEIEISLFVRVQEARVLTDWEEVRALAPLHILEERVVRERFDYDQAPGVHVAWVEVFPRAGLAFRGCEGVRRLPQLGEVTGAADGNGVSPDRRGAVTERFFRPRRRRAVLLPHPAPPGCD